MRTTASKTLQDLVALLSEARRMGSSKKEPPKERVRSAKKSSSRSGPRKMAASPFERLAREKEDIAAARKGTSPERSKFRGRRVTNILKKKESGREYRAQIKAKHTRNKREREETHHGRKISLARTTDVTRKNVRAHNPFKRRSTMGPTRVHSLGNPPNDTRRVQRKRDWSCRKIEKYKQLCIGKPKKEGGKKRKMVVNIDPGYKKAYNRSWKQHEKELRHAGGEHHKFYKKHGSFGSVGS